MNQNLQKISDFLQQTEQLTTIEKASLSKAVKDTQSELAIAAFKLDRTEKVKRTTAILLEETIEELEKKREAVEAQNRELEIEFSLERVRTVAMGMRKPGDLLSICEILYAELQNMGFGELRNAMINIHNDEKGSFLNYDFSESAGATLTTILYNSHPATENLVKQVRSATDAFAEFVIKGNELDEWREYRKSMGEQDDPKLTNIQQLSYYFFSIGTGAIGISTYNPITEEKRNVLKRFRNVFELAYRRYIDVSLAEAQAREARIELALERVRARTMAMQKSDELGETAFLLFQQFQELGETPDQITIGIIKEESGLIEFWITINGNQIDRNVVASVEEPNLMNKLFVAWKSNEKSIVVTLSGKHLNDFIAYRREISSHIETPAPRHYSENRRTVHSAFFSKGFITFSSDEPKPTETLRLLERFAGVFDQTYTRFLDLQKAETQVREAKIEAGLERVRASAMAMQNSNELADLVATLFKELIRLDFALTRCYIYIIDPETLAVRAWTFNTEIDELPESYYIKYLDLPYYKAMINAWKERNQKFVYELGGEEKQEVDRVLLNETEYSRLPDQVKSGMKSADRVYLSYSFNNFGGLQTGGLEPLSNENLDIFSRFGKVFDLTYTRFNDLKQAEAQAREAQIEAALEKIRSRSLAMFRSDELKDVIAIMSQKLKELGVLLGTVAIQLFDQKNRNSFFWAGNEFHDESPLVNLPYSEKIFNEDTFLKDSWEGRITNESIINKEYSREQKDKYFTYVFAHNDLTVIPQEVREFIMQAQSHIACLIVEKNSALFADSWNGQFYDDEMLKVLKRAAKVFEQAYIRFLDLQKAEAQAREAQIEAALEKVRSRSLAMHKSDELQEVVFTVLLRLKDLNIKTGSTNILIFNDNKKELEQWVANDMNYAELFKVPYESGYYTEEFFTAKSNSGHYQKNYSASENRVKFEIGFAETEFARIGDERKAYLLSLSGGTEAVAFGKNAAISLYRYEIAPFADDEIKVLQRFVKVFEQAYTRFLDLQRAEAQAREAIIESALERVRSKTMAMHNSEDVGDTVSTMFDELVKLGIRTNRCGILIYTDTMTAEVWTAKSNPEGKAILITGRLDLTVHPLLRGAHDTWKNKLPIYSYPMIGDDLIVYYKAINDSQYYPTRFDLETLPSKEFHTDFYFTEGSIFAFTAEPISAEASVILKRFAGVFGQTYRRYLDLQKSEANAIEAIRRSSLDRVRAETASMRTKDDLERITPLIWNELTTLGVPFTRCGVFIMDQQHEQIHTFLSTPDGKAIAAFHLPYNTAQTTFLNLVEFWQKKQLYKEHWDEAAFLNWTKNLVKSGAIAPTEKYVTGHHPTNLDLHFLPFLQGMLYVGNDKPLNEDELQLVQNLADAFSTAYARYEDFNKLESAKAQIEKTLVDLKQTQAQLVQAEKMASLGELTAGIAHEIQNPLNFVNNFSEVNTELIEEMKEEIEKGNLDEVKLLANDIADNEQKINHHGKRADAIVKGMLQHSRSSSGVKEPTDINALADEYLRLAYHGLRAKDKSFNATMKTDFDETIGNINIIPQDIGRVILNLITNAFYAVKAPPSPPAGGGLYEPTVTVRTSLNPPWGGRGASVSISVRDNGPGIPAHILDKIFQPFFTTKPTGQGTGLGLSMSYDIVKAHGGEIKVESVEGEGTEFIVEIPLITLS